MENKQVIEFNNNLGLALSTDEITSSIKQRVFDGEVSAVDTGIILKKLEKICKDIKEDKVFNDFVKDETIKAFDGKALIKFGFKISERNNRTAYDFTVCNDPLYNKLAEIQAEIKEAIKAREEQLKALIPKESVLNFAIASTETKTIIAAMPELLWRDGDGEEIIIKQPIKYQGSGLVYTEIKEK